MMKRTIIAAALAATVTTAAPAHAWSFFSATGFSAPITNVATQIRSVFGQISDAVRSYQYVSKDAAVVKRNAELTTAGKAPLPGKCTSRCRANAYDRVLYSGGGRSYTWTGSKLDLDGDVRDCGGTSPYGGC